MRNGINTPATCESCAHYDTSKPNPLSGYGECAITEDDGLPPIIPINGIPPNHPGCEYYTFKKELTK